MDISRERVGKVVTAFRPYDMGNMTEEKRADARALLALLRSDVHATGRADLIELVDSAAACVSSYSAPGVEDWLGRLMDRISPQS